MTDAKADLLRYLTIARESLLWKLDGASEYDIRRPMTGTGTNLLGLVKHTASMDLVYFAETFGRPSPEAIPWLDDDAEANADMWATAAESREDIVNFYKRVRVHSDTTISMLDLDSPGHVAWWPADRNPVTLHQILIHVIAETNRHVGHADIIREQLDGAIGFRVGNEALPPVDAGWWATYVERLESIARAAGA